MGDFGLKKNASGYVDPTAYEAIKNADIPKPGEIYLITKKAGSAVQEEEFLVIKGNERYCNVLKLSDSKFNDSCIKVISRTVKFTDPGMISYTFTNNPMQFIKRLPFDEFSKVLEVIEDHFGIVVDVVMHEKENEPVQSESLTTEVKQIVEVCEVPSKESEAEIVKYKTLYETFKELYDTLLERVMTK